MESDQIPQPQKTTSSATSSSGRTKVTARVEGKSLQEFVENLPDKPVSLKATLPKPKSP